MKLRKNVTDVLSNPITRMSKDLLQYGAAKIIPAGMSFAGVFIFTRIFTAEEFGVYSIVMAIIIPMTVLNTEWAAQPVGRFYSEYEHNNRMEIYNSILIRNFGIILTISITCSIVLAYVLKLYYGFSISIAAGSFILGECIYGYLIPIVPASLNSVFYKYVSIVRSTLGVACTLWLLVVFEHDESLMLWGPCITVFGILPFLVNKVAKATNIKKKGQIRLFKLT